MRIMRTLLVGVGLLVSLNAAQDNSDKERVYLAEQDVCFHKQQIFANLNGEWVPVRTISSDQQGVYVLARDLPFGFWVCDRCGTGNPPWRIACSTCGGPK